MTDTLKLILEDTDGTQLETSCTRFAVVWQGKEVWMQQAGNGQLLIGGADLLLAAQALRR